MPPRARNRSPGMTTPVKAPRSRKITEATTVSTIAPTIPSLVPPEASTESPAAGRFPARVGPPTDLGAKGTVTLDFGTMHCGDLDGRRDQCRGRSIRPEGNVPSLDRETGWDSWGP